MLGVVALKVFPVLKFGQQLPTTRNNMQQRAKVVKTDATSPWELLAKFVASVCTGLPVTSIMFCFEFLLMKIFTVHEDAPNFCVDSDL